MNLDRALLTPYSARDSGKDSRQRGKTAVRGKSAHLNVQCRWPHQRCQSDVQIVVRLLVLSCGQVCRAAVLLTSLSNFMRRRGGFARDTDRLLLLKQLRDLQPLAVSLLRLHKPLLSVWCRVSCRTLLSCPKRAAARGATSAILPCLCHSRYILSLAETNPALRVPRCVTNHYEPSLPVCMETNVQDEEIHIS